MATKPLEIGDEVFEVERGNVYGVAGPKKITGISMNWGEPRYTLDFSPCLTLASRVFRTREHAEQTANRLNALDDQVLEPIGQYRKSA